MRLFIAMNFNDRVKKQIRGIINQVKSKSLKGRFVNEEHIHLTVEFLGEIQNKRVDTIKEIMNNIVFDCFSISLTKVGYFKSRDGDIYWIGLEQNDSLSNIYKELHHSLKGNGFQLENRDYKPHITIGRKVKLLDGTTLDEINNEVSKIKIDMNKIDLMKSEFCNGTLKYSVVESRFLC